MRSLSAGRYALTVEDESADAGFSLQRLPGQPVTITATAFTGEKTVELSLRAGEWSFFASPARRTRFAVS